MTSTSPVSRAFFLGAFLLLVVPAAFPQGGARAATTEAPFPGPATASPAPEGATAPPTGPASETAPLPSAAPPSTRVVSITEVPVALDSCGPGDVSIDLGPAPSGATSIVWHVKAGGVMRSYMVAGENLLTGGHVAFSAPEGRGILSLQIDDPPGATLPASISWPACPREGEESAEAFAPFHRAFPPMELDPWIGLAFLSTRAAPSLSLSWRSPIRFWERDWTVDAELGWIGTSSREGLRESQSGVGYSSSWQLTVVPIEGALLTALPLPIPLPFSLYGGGGIGVAYLHYGWSYSVGAPAGGLSNVTPVGDLRAGTSVPLGSFRLNGEIRLGILPFQGGKGVGGSTLSWFSLLFGTRF